MNNKKDDSASTNTTDNLNIDIYKSIVTNEFLDEIFKKEIKNCEEIIAENEIYGYFPGVATIVCSSNIERALSLHFASTGHVDLSDDHFFNIFRILAKKTIESGDLPLVVLTCFDSWFLEIDKNDPDLSSVIENGISDNAKRKNCISVQAATLDGRYKTAIIVVSVGDNGKYIVDEIRSIEIQAPLEQTMFVIYGMYQEIYGDK